MGKCEQVEQLMGQLAELSARGQADTPQAQALAQQLQHALKVRETHPHVIMHMDTLACQVYRAFNN